MTGITAYAIYFSAWYFGRAYKCGTAQPVTRFFYLALGASLAAFAGHELGGGKWF